jgi:dihydrofolate reductase
LIYTAIGSLDGYIEDTDGNFDWAAPDEEMHAFVNDTERPIGTYLFGRRLYETMVYWETADAIPDRPQVERDYTKIWQAADKIVFSRTLHGARSARTRVEQEFVPELVQALKSSSERDLSVGGAELGAAALRAGLVDEVQLFLQPLTVGGGKPALPGGVHLRLVEQRRFGSGAVYLRYTTGRVSQPR